ncbi:MAG: TetR/AcrR family transcriptional regulator [Gammaproteobacteria bacterium]
MGDNARDSNNNSARAVTRRAQLVKAAITVFSRVGFHEATVRQITDTAGVSAGLAYQYVADKHDLLFLALRHIVETNRREIPSAIGSSPDALLRLIRAIEAYTHVIAANREAVLLTYRETKSLRPDDVESIKKMELDTNALIAACVEECVAAGFLASHHTELLVFRIITAAHAWALKNWRLRAIVSLEEYIEQSIHACWRPLLTAKGRKRQRQLLEGAH